MVILPVSLSSTAGISRIGSWWTCATTSWFNCNCWSQSLSPAPLEVVDNLGLFDVSKGSLLLLIISPDKNKTKELFQQEPSFKNFLSQMLIKYFFFIKRILTWNSVFVVCHRFKRLCHGCIDKINGGGKWHRQRLLSLHGLRHSGLGCFLLNFRSLDQLTSVIRRCSWWKAGFLFLWRRLRLIVTFS